MLVILEYQSGINQPVVARTAVGAIERAFDLPIELSGISVSINGAACGLKRVGQRTIELVTPRGLEGAATGTSYPIVIHNNGVVMRKTVTFVPARPDIFRSDGEVAPLGRAKLFNVTNSVFTTEPFAVRTIRRKGNRLVPSVLRIHVTGVANMAAACFRPDTGSRTALGNGSGRDRAGCLHLRFQPGRRPAWGRRSADHRQGYDRHDGLRVAA